MTCEFDWCATEHGIHAHPEDDDHRSAGVGSTAVLRRDDDHSWLVIDAGQGLGIEIAIDSARRIVHSLLRDDAFRRLLRG